MWEYVVWAAYNWIRFIWESSSSRASSFSRLFLYFISTLILPVFSYSVIIYVIHSLVYAAWLVTTTLLLFVHVCWPCTPSWHFLSRWGCFLTTLDLYVPGTRVWIMDIVPAGDHRLPDQLVETSLQLVQSICTRSAGRSLSVRSWGLFLVFIHLCIDIPSRYLWYSIIVTLYLKSVISTYLYSDYCFYHILFRD